MESVASFFFLVLVLLFFGGIVGVGFLETGDIREVGNACHDNAKDLGSGFLQGIDGGDDFRLLGEVLCADKEEAIQITGAEKRIGDHQDRRGVDKDKVVSLPKLLKDGFELLGFQDIGRKGCLGSGIDKVDPVFRMDDDVIDRVDIPADIVDDADPVPDVVEVMDRRPADIQVDDAGLLAPVGIEIGQIADERRLSLTLEGGGHANDLGGMSKRGKADIRLELLDGFGSRGLKVLDDDGLIICRGHMGSLFSFSKALHFVSPLDSISGMTPMTLRPVIASISEAETTWVLHNSKIKP